jgi:hypothetical protein
VKEYDLMLITEYADENQSRLSEERFSQIIKELAPQGPKLLDDLKTRRFSSERFQRYNRNYIFIPPLSIVSAKASAIVRSFAVLLWAGSGTFRAAPVPSPILVETRCNSTSDLRLFAYYRRV